MKDREHIEPRFTRGEYWLLETVVESLFPVSGLIDDDFEVSLNKKGHGLTRAALIETLHRLISSGLIYAESEVNGLISTDQHIERALNEPWGDTASIDPKTITYYGLTQEGGAQWEAFAAPDWQRYVDASSRVPDESENVPDGYVVWEMICPYKVRLETYFKSMYMHGHCEVILESVMWDYIEPWDATYWKQLDGAYRVRFQDPDNAVKSEHSLPDLPYSLLYQVWCAWR